jgi:hypothetical protein
MLSILLFSAVTEITAAAVAREIVPTVIAAPAGAHEPWIAARGARVFVAFGTTDTVDVFESRDGGARTALHTIAHPGQLALGLSRGTRIVALADGGAVVTAIAGKQGHGRDENLYAWRSVPGEKPEDMLGWSEAVRVNDVEGSAREGLHAFAIGPRDELFSAWIDLRESKSVLYGARSEDRGRSWSTPAVVYRSPEGSICECCAPALAFDEQGELFAMWRNQLGGSRDLHVARSKDGGRTFGEARKQGLGTWKLAACPMDGGSIASLAAGLVTSVWRREGTLYRSDAAEPEHEFARGEQPVIARGPGGAWIGWSEKRGGSLRLLAPGAKEPIELAPAALDLVLSSPIDGQGPVFASWETAEGKLCFARVDG